MLFFVQIKTKSIVLRVVKYGDSQLIVDALTESHGRLSFIQRVPKSQRSRVPKQLFRPMAVLNIAFDYRQRQRLQRITEASMAFPLTSVPFEASKFTIAMFLAEFTCLCTRAEQQNSSLFAFVEHSVRWLDLCERDFANFHIIYMVHLAPFVGFAPNLSADEGDVFDLRAGCFVSLLPSHNDYLLPADGRRLRLLLRLSYATMHLLRLSHDERNRMVDAIVTFYRLHVPDFPEPRSLAVLREVFA